MCGACVLKRLNTIINVTVLPVTRDHYCLFIKKICSDKLQDQSKVNIEGNVSIKNDI